MSRAVVTSARVFMNSAQLGDLSTMTIPGVYRNVVEDSRHASGEAKVPGYLRFTPLQLTTFSASAILALLTSLVNKTLDAYVVMTTDSVMTFSAHVLSLKFDVATVDGLYAANIILQPLGVVTLNGQLFGTPVVTVLAAPVVTEDVLLLEDGTSLLLETGDTIVL